MVAKKILFVEGESGDLRQGFSKLLEKSVRGNLPKINLGGGKFHTIRKFLNNQLEADAILLLVDLDGPEAEKEQDLQRNDLSLKQQNVFYMVQEMESWFLSQPVVLDTFFGPDPNSKKVSDKLSKRKAIDIVHPKEVLKNVTKDSKRGTYHEMKHAVELLKLLDAEQLESDFIDFKNLVERLRQQR